MLTSSTITPNTIARSSTPDETAQGDRALHRIRLVGRQLLSAEERNIDAPLPLMKVTLEELEQAVMAEPAFRQYLNRHAGTGKESLVKRQWLLDLAAAVNGKLSGMRPGERGIELTFRFRKAYKDVHHIAAGALWRDEEGGLKLGLAHQESIPIGNSGRSQGLVFDTFSTERYFQDKRAPVLSSMERHGPPDVMVRTCAYPQNISVMAKWLNDEENCRHPYGFDGKKNEQGFHELTCFSITSAVHKSLRGEFSYVDTKPTLPDGFRDVIVDLFGKESYER